MRQRRREPRESPRIPGAFTLYSPIFAHPPLVYPPTLLPVIVRDRATHHHPVRQKFPRPMKAVSMDPVQQQRVLAEFSLRRAAGAQRAAQVRRARFGAPWLWVGFALMAWVPVAAGWLVDLTSVTGRVLMVAPVVGMGLLGVAMTRSIIRAREELFLTIIEREAPAEYRRLQQDGIVRRERGRWSGLN